MSYFKGVTFFRYIFQQEAPFLKRTWRARISLNGKRIDLGVFESEVDAADAEGFLEELLACCPVLGLHVFTPASAPENKGNLLQIVAKGIKAEGVEAADGFVVSEGSRAVSQEVPSCPSFVTNLRKALVENGVLRADGDSLLFTQDYVFNSPSTAAAVVQARNANGRLDWKTKDGRNLADIQQG